jgi:hypothetical protein
MGRILGKVEYGSGAPPKYLIHCSTGDSSFRPLYEAPEEAWRVYDDSGIDGLYVAVPAISKLVHVVRLSFSYGRTLASEDDVLGEVEFGLATEDRLLSPTVRFGSSGYSLIRRDEALHISSRVDGGFFGTYDSPVCDGGLGWVEGDEQVWLGDFFGKELQLCPRCVDTVLKDLP